jgi:hypothetical protein
VAIGWEVQLEAIAHRLTLNGTENLGGKIDGIKHQLGQRDGVWHIGSLCSGRLVELHSRSERELDD